jgi:hypothetical protein
LENVVAFDVAALSHEDEHRTHDLASTRLLSDKSPSTGPGDHLTLHLAPASATGASGEVADNFQDVSSTLPVVYYGLLQQYGPVTK